MRPGNERAAIQFSLTMQLNTYRVKVTFRHLGYKAEQTVSVVSNVPGFSVFPAAIDAVKEELPEREIDPPKKFLRMMDANANTLDVLEDAGVPEWLEALVVKIEMVGKGGE